jgi:hypothetical protein
MEQHRGLELDISDLDLLYRRYALALIGCLDSLFCTEITHLTAAQDDILTRFNNVSEKTVVQDVGEVSLVDPRWTYS